jgi:ribosomal protein S12 methylthiotransferase
MSEKRLFHFLNLGCSKNVVDGESIIAFMELAGWQLTQSPASASFIIVNTCAFIETARTEAVNEILEMSLFKNNGQCRTLAVAGCFSQRYCKDASRSMPEVDIWLSLTNWKQELTDYLNFAQISSKSETRHLTGLAATQYLKIAEGCSHKCAFCAIPLIRGSFRSRPIQSVIDEAKWLENRGVRECILVAQDSSCYGRDSGTSLVKLIEKILASTSFEWIRVMYLYPAFVSNELLSLFAGEKRICPYFDMPLQHSSDEILTAMRRRPGHMDTRKLIERIRTVVTDAAIRTTFITGFPGETEKHFAHLVEFVKWARFDKMGVFTYSPEKGTASYEFSKRPKPSTALRRSETLIEIQREISASILSSRKNSIIPVIIDSSAGKAGKQTCIARTRRDAPEVDGTVKVLQCKSRPGNIIRVRITATSDYDMTGREETALTT